MIPETKKQAGQRIKLLLILGAFIAWSVLVVRTNLIPLENFQWYGTNHIAAPNGVYFGFSMGGVPHVRIQKIRHVWRGIAFVDGPSGFAALEGQTAISYSRVESSNWHIWGTKD